MTVALCPPKLDTLIVDSGVVLRLSCLVFCRLVDQLFFPVFGVPGVDQLVISHLYSIMYRLLLIGFCLFLVLDAIKIRQDKGTRRFPNYRWPDCSKHHYPPWKWQLTRSDPDYRGLTFTGAKKLVKKFIAKIKSAAVPYVRLYFQQFDLNHDGFISFEGPYIPCQVSFV